jgi:translation initiation factor IF-3
MAHPELGKKVLDEVLEKLGPIAKVDTEARLDGRNMTMVLSPDKKAAANAKKANAKPAAPAAASTTSAADNNSKTA